MQNRTRVPRSSATFGITLLSSLLGGTLFMLLHLPIPWLLGPMLAVLIGSNTFKNCFAWPGKLRDTGMIIVGYTIGLSLTAAALKQMSHQLPTMLFMTAVLLIFCAGIAYAVSRLSGLNYRTVLLGSIPGGLTQMIVLAEETEDINITVVTVIQVIRLMMIILCVPLLVFSPLLGNSSAGEAAAPLTPSAEAVQWGGMFPNILIFAALCTLFGWLGAKIRFPTPYLLGPAIIASILQISGIHGPALPSLLLNAAQLMIGVYVGLLLNPGNLPNKLRTLLLAAASSVVLIAGAWGLSALLSRVASVSPSTALLSLAPGGMDQMSLMAHEVDANLSMVAGFQLFRTFFIFFAVPPLFKLIFRGKSRRTAEVCAVEKK